MKKYNEQLMNHFKKLSLSIKNIYNKLNELEVEGLKESDEYRKNLDYLKIAVECEEDKYKELNNADIVNLLNIIKIKMITLNYQSTDIVLDNIDSDNEQVMIYIRIALKLYNMKNKTMGNISLMFENDILDYTFIELMNRYADFHNCDILKLKYRLSFLVPKIEKYNVGNDFSSGSFVSLDEDDDQSIIMEDGIFEIRCEDKFLAFERAIMIINMILKIDNDEVKNKKNVVKLLSYYLGACFYYLGNQDIIFKINEMFHNYIDSDEYCEEYGINYTSAIASVRNVFCNVNRNKEYLDGKTLVWKKNKFYRKTLI